MICTSSVTATINLVHGFMYAMCGVIHVLVPFLYLVATRRDKKNN